MEHVFCAAQWGHLAVASALYDLLGQPQFEFKPRWIDIGVKTAPSGIAWLLERATRVPYGARITYNEDALVPRVACRRFHQVLCLLLDRGCVFKHVQSLAMYCVTNLQLMQLLHARAGCDMQQAVMFERALDFGTEAVVEWLLEQNGGRCPLSPAAFDVAYRRLHSKGDRAMMACTMRLQLGLPPPAVV